MQNPQLYQEQPIQQQNYYTEKQPLVQNQQYSGQIIAGPVRVDQKNSFLTTCPNCHQQISTRVEKKIGIGNFILCVGCLIVGCDMGCCLIPFCMDGIKDVNHKCPYCNTTVGVSPII